MNDSRKKQSTAERPNDNDNVELSFPVNSAYVSAARLTASSIANRIGFDADEIEDVKAAVSEACIFIIKNAPSHENAMFKVRFFILDSAVTIDFICSQRFKKINDEEEMGLLMIRALTDEMNIDINGEFKLTMKKRHKNYDFI